MKLHEIYEGIQFTNIMSIAQRIVDLKNRQKFREKMSDAEYKWLMLTCENYLYVMRHLKKEASNDALVKCYVGLKKSADELAENGFTSINYHNNKKLADMLLEQIEGKVVEEI